jgi:putative membrane protein
MMGWHGPMWWWGWPFSGVLHFLVIIAVIVAVIAFARSSGRGQNFFPPQRLSALDALNQRYARGEIGREEYLQKRGDIEGAPPPPAA